VSKIRPATEDPVLANWRSVRKVNYRASRKRVTFWLIPEIRAACLPAHVSAPLKPHLGNGPGNPIAMSRKAVGAARPNSSKKATPRPTWRAF